MLSYLLRRLALTVPVLLGVATLVFLLLHLVPGDPAVSMLGEGARTEDVEALRTRLGLDRPILVQYGAFLGGLARGSLGTSFRNGLPVMTEVIDVLMAFPGILLAIALVAVRGPSLGNVVLALSVVGWVGYARLVRGQVLRLRELEFVQAARALGAGLPRILLRHVLPATLPAVVVQATLGMAGAILSEASLSFLGLGVQPPTPSWGAMLDAGRAHLVDAPHLTLFPGASIAVVVIGFNLLGDGLRDWLSPR